MGLIWCTRRGKQRGFQNELVACVACNCSKRKTCKPYASLPAQSLIAAQAEADSNGHDVCGAMPLFAHALQQKSR
jgi:hypothetical protein